MHTGWSTDRRCKGNRVRSRFANRNPSRRTSALRSRNRRRKLQACTRFRPRTCGTPLRHCRFHLVRRWMLSRLGIAMDRQVSPRPEQSCTLPASSAGCISCRYRCKRWRSRRRRRKILSDTRCRNYRPPPFPSISPQRRLSKQPAYPWDDPPPRCRRDQPRQRWSACHRNHQRRYRRGSCPMTCSRCRLVQQRKPEPESDGWEHQVPYATKACPWNAFSPRLRKLRFAAQHAPSIPWIKDELRGLRSQRGQGDAPAAGTIGSNRIGSRRSRHTFRLNHTDSPR
jgi:hypothetical protein